MQATWQSIRQSTSKILVFVCTAYATFSSSLTRFEILCESFCDEVFSFCHMYLKQGTVCVFMYPFSILNIDIDSPSFGTVFTKTPGLLGFFCSWFVNWIDWKTKLHA